MSDEVHSTHTMVLRITRKLEEMNDRLIRLETRMVRLAESHGINTKKQVAIYNPKGVVLAIPSLDIGLRDLLEVLPPGEVGAIPIIHVGRTVGAISR